MDLQAKDYYDPELIFELTKMAVSFGYLQPNSRVTKQLKYYEQNNHVIKKPPQKNYEHKKVKIFCPQNGKMTY